MGWDSDEDDILNDFYKPVLLHAKKYQRLAGYFSSTTFIVAIKESLDFIKKGGIMQLVTSADLSKYDKETIEKTLENHEQVLSSSFLEDLENDDELTKKCSSILGYMLANKTDDGPQLEIKIAIPLTQNDSIYHQKVGVLTLEDDNTISFSGSVNETGRAWKDNIEEFKVFKSWGGETHENAIELDKKKFQKFWEGKSEKTLVYELPEAVKQHLLKIRPRSTKEFDETIEDLRRVFDTKIFKPRYKLRTYQERAISNWINNDYRGLFEMATGTGKTFAALGCINKLQKIKPRLVIIIASPQKHIVEQWVENINDWNTGFEKNLRINNTATVKAFSDNVNWKSDLEAVIRNFNKKSFSGKHFLNELIIHTTHNTISSSEFIDKISKINGEILFIVDEVHGIGSEKLQNSMLDKYDYRLGLSATPTRHYDDQGSELIRQYFGGIVYELPIREAIQRGFLVPYDYLPVYTELTSVEMGEYRELTRKIAQKFSSKRDQIQIEREFSTFYENERANLIANAERKFTVLGNILDSKNNKLRDTLIYCHDRQLNQVTRILTNRNIANDSITWKDPTYDRTRILNNLANHHYDCITAIKCLDEGVDIPSAQTAIIMASTGNPRQYIQRRGRVLRQNPATNKTKAVIYDILVKPPLSNNAIISTMERKLVAKELLRHKEFAETALNRTDAIEKIRSIADTYDIDFDRLSYDYIETL